MYVFYAVWYQCIVPVCFPLPRAERALEAGTCSHIPTKCFERRFFCFAGSLDGKIENSFIQISKGLKIFQWRYNEVDFSYWLSQGSVSSGLARLWRQKGILEKDMKSYYRLIVGWVPNLKKQLKILLQDLRTSSNLGDQGMEERLDFLWSIYSFEGLNQ